MSHPSPKRIVVAAIVGVATFQALMLLAFAWPSSNAGPRDVPIAVAGPPQVTGEIADRLSGVRVVDDDTAAFDVTTVADRNAAVDTILDRETYGAVVVSPDGPELLVASGASPVVARLLQNAASNLAEDGSTVAVTDVVPPDPDDPNGAGLATGVFPLIMTSAIGGLVAFLLLRRTWHRTAMVLGLSAVGGLASAAILQYWLGVLDGPYWALAGIIALVIGGVSGAVMGLGAALGKPAAGLTLVTLILLGIPMSAATSAPELLPQPWGDIGQLMPPGAGINAIRSAVFFDGAAIGTPLVVLGVWVVAGLGLILLGALRGRSASADTDATEPTQPRTIPAST